MTVVSTNPDRDALTFTIVAEFETAVERLWQVWEDPRQLESWWGPPTWPATFEQHDFREGGESRYFMTGPEGERAHGWWRLTAIEPPRKIEFEDGFADENGNRNDQMPTMNMEVSFEQMEGKARMTSVARFESLEDLDKVMEMGMEEGMAQAMSQIDSLL